MNKKAVLPILVLLATLATIAYNSLAEALPINGLTTGEISDRFAIYFVPAGYVFSIWGLIYIALIAYGIYQVLPARWDDARLRRIAPWYLLSCLGNVAWLTLWHYERITLSILPILLLLVSLIGVYVGLGVGRRPFTRRETWLARIPFSIYLGWASVATIANISTALYDLGWNGWGLSAVTWTVIMLIVGALLALIALITRRDAVFSLVFVWAFAGIAVKHSGTPTVLYTGAVLAGLIFVAAVIYLLRGTVSNASPDGS